ncbi:MAG: hypothetical protein QM778_26290 [Myxococcales bacterium]
MLARYQIVRGKRAPDDPLPQGHRMDTRKHTKHVLRPEAAMVEELFEDLSDAAFKRFAAAYRKLLEQRFHEERERFDEIAELARHEDVFLGCNCPSLKNPDVQRCHTVLALEFFKHKYLKLRVVMP